MERSYTVKEIDALRRAMESKFLWHRYSGPSGHSSFSGSYRAEEKTIAVEEWTRTAMLAGHTAEDLIASEKTDGAAT